MKTQEQIEKLIQEQLEKLAAQRDAADKKEKATQGKIDFYKHVARYVETKPSPEFVKSEIERLRNVKQNILDKCATFKSKASVSKEKAARNYSTINQQLKTLEFIYYE